MKRGLWVLTGRRGIFISPLFIGIGPTHLPCSHLERALALGAFQSRMWNGIVIVIDAVLTAVSPHLAVALCQWHPIQRIREALIAPNLIITDTFPPTYPRTLVALYLYSSLLAYAEVLRNRKLEARRADSQQSSAMMVVVSQS